jgi:hypothetical protein
MPGSMIWLRIPEHTAGPIQLTVMADGQTFWSGSGPPTSTVIYDHGRNVVLPVVALYGPPFGTLPSFWGVHRLEISASDGRGNPIVRRTVVLPDWTRIARRAPAATREVDQLARGAGCLPATVA